MGSVTSVFGGPIRVVYFSEDIPASNGTRLVAAVVWRVPSGAGAARWRDALRRFRYRVGRAFMAGGANDGEAERDAPGRQ
jgi:hypothetical protein